jgi:hypothetical protein
MSDTEPSRKTISFPISDEAAAKLWSLPHVTLPKATWTPIGTPEQRAEWAAASDPVNIAQQAIREMVAFPGSNHEVPVSGDWDDDFEDGKWRPQMLHEYLANTHIHNSADDLMRRAASAVVEALRDKGLLQEP